jgi:hypothetical protein
MEIFRRTFNFFILVLIGILCFQFSFSQTPDPSRQVLGKWKYEKHIYDPVSRYGKDEVEAIKSSQLCFLKDKVYFTDLAFIDTCFYSEIHPKAFFDNEFKKPDWRRDGPVALKYTEKQLSNFIRIDLNCNRNHLGCFYLNADTLILNSSGGVTFFFTKSKSTQTN